MSVPNSADQPFDLVLVGGGLQNGLIALSALHNAPDCRLAMIEAGPRLGGNHTWCVHGGDVSSGAQVWFAPLVEQRWTAYDVQFPGHARTVHSSYSVVSSDRFASVVTERLAEHPRCVLLTGTKALEVGAHEVRLDNGATMHGRLVVDARGPDPSAYRGRCGYQKFLGLELVLREPHQLARPILMDATCAQLDGYRFFYVLPLGPERLLIEETRFARGPELDVAGARAAIYAYAARFGSVLECAREETGVLPMPWSMGFATPQRADSPLLAGYRGGYFHPATGYSMPVALRAAEVIGRHVLCEPLGVEWQRFVQDHRAQATYALGLNRLLFTGFAETDMWGVLSRFYHLPEALIERFYALSSSLSDRARILVGRPPRGFSARRMLRGGAA
jgi:lycopene beta-cyclase